MGALRRHKMLWDVLRVHRAVKPKPITTAATLLQLSHKSPQVKPAAGCAGSKQESFRSQPNNGQASAAYVLRLSIFAQECIQSQSFHSSSGLLLDAQCQFLNGMA